MVTIKISDVYLTLKTKYLIYDILYGTFGVCNSSEYYWLRHLVTLIAFWCVTGDLGKKNKNWSIKILVEINWKYLEIFFFNHFGEPVVRCNQIGKKKSVIKNVEREEVASKIMNCHICSSAVTGCASTKFQTHLISLKIVETLTWLQEMQDWALSVK